jgi:hypothetical protein
MPPHILNLKVNSVIILFRNINVRLGFCNGTRMRVTRLFDNLIQAECIKTKRRALIPRMQLTSEVDHYPFKMRRLQYPVRPGYAMTGNKAQGQTLDRLGIYLPQPFFAHGQLYVSFSRVRNAANIKVLMLDSQSQGRMTLDTRRFFTRNVVYRELLARQPPQPVLRLTAPNQQQLNQANDAANMVPEVVEEEPEDNDLDRQLEQHMVEFERLRANPAPDDIEQLSQSLDHISLTPTQ